MAVETNPADDPIDTPSPRVFVTSTRTGAEDHNYQRGVTNPVGRYRGAILGSMLALCFLAPAANAQLIAPSGAPTTQIELAQDSSGARALSDAERALYAKKLPSVESTTWSQRARYRELYNFMTARVRGHVTPLARIVTGNGRMREILPTKDSGNENVVVQLSGLGSDRVWAAWGLASTSAGQDRHGLTAEQNAHHYADIDDYTFLIRKKDSDGNFVTIGTTPGIDSKTGKGRLVAPVPLFVKFDGPGEYEIVFNPFPKGMSDAEITARLGYLCWRDGGVTTTGVAFPPHPDNPHTEAVSPFGFPLGRITRVVYDGT